MSSHGYRIIITEYSLPARSEDIFDRFLQGLGVGIADQLHDVGGNLEAVWPLQVPPYSDQGVTMTLEAQAAVPARLVCNIVSLVVVWAYRFHDTLIPLVSFKS